MNLCFLIAVIVYSVSANNCRKEILSLRKENYILKTKIDAFDDKLDYFMTSMTKLGNDIEKNHIANYHGMLVFSCFAPDLPTYYFTSYQKVKVNNKSKRFKGHTIVLSVPS